MLPAAWSLVFMMFGIYNPGIQWNWSDQIQTPCSCDSLASNKSWTFSKIASTVVSEWSLVCGDSWKGSTIISIQMVGALLGSCSGGQIGDRFGRKFSIHGGAALLVITNFIAVFSVSWGMYAAVRFFIGFAAGSMLSTIPVYCLEFVPGSWRGITGTFPFWSLSTLAFSICVMILRNWRYVHLATAFFALLSFLPVFWLPESMRILTIHGNLKGANKVVQKIARLNRKPVPDTSVMATIAEVERKSLMERPSYNYRDLFHSSIRRYTIVMAMMWLTLTISNNTVGYGLKAFTGDYFVNFIIFSALPIPARLFVVILTSKVGRKTILAVSMCLACVFSFLIVGIQLLAPAEVVGTSTIALAFASNMIIEIGWAMSPLIVAELFPTGVRNMAYAFCNIHARIGSIIAPYMLPNHSLPIWVLFLVIGVLILICFVSVLTLPESKGWVLQENLMVKAPVEAIAETKDSEVASNV
ncbi:unnamed protein product [Candidula unifasciata]|uniref:Major facilitator superfamily (MFS) profile domain-containing protein n=1 Tax=Candidula unifasciata TaxID=100452 RepID=A0A8S4A1E1_9EUPU|nr:unnamed protein product [Candidula unifasciata]